jgi:hypothetical protein
MITVISTSFAPPADAKARCLASTHEQTPPGKAIYIDAATQSPPRSHFENLLEATTGLPDNEVIVSLDGDDWLTPGALERVEREYHDHPATLVTWGSFVFADGRPGFARALTTAEWSCPRSAPWVTTHLKTFRAGLLRRINPNDLKDGHYDWLEHARDLALMYPLLEMAGPERARFIPDILCVYNFANSTEFNGGPTMLAAERAAVRYVRGLPPYEQWLDLTKIPPGYPYKGLP